jgi:UDP-N-acetylglucosamine 1-carboxyvinyltransferase
MTYLNIKGEAQLSGEIDIGGAKNAALPLLASSILSKKSFTINNLPNVVDIRTFIKLLTMLGANCQHTENQISIDTTSIDSTKATYDIVKTMRASILVLGPLLARFGHCEVSLPGGCAIGQRPIDLHLKALEQMGADITIEAGYVNAKAPNGLIGTDIVFDKVTVTGTENIVMAATLAKGVTKIINAAKEPEVVQLCEVIQKAGVKIDGVGTSTLTIEGSDKKLLEFESFDVIPDRIEAGTYLCAGAITNSKITLNKVNISHIDAIVSKLKEMGFEFDISKNSITIIPTKNIKPIHITTTEYPGFPTDMQAQFMALATQSNGSSVIDERLFENRFMHVSELIRMGADITLNGSVANINPTKELSGADVMATDLRASSALILAALVAKGESNIHRIYHLDRGYEKLEEKLNSLGAKVTRYKEEN